MGRYQQELSKSQFKLRKLEGSQDSKFPFSFYSHKNKIVLLFINMFLHVLNQKHLHFKSNFPIMLCRPLISI